MLYTAQDKDFSQHVHPNLRRRIRIFLTMGGVMLAIVLWDIFQGTMSISLAAIGILLGSAVGVLSSRIFHLSWDHDGQHVVGKIDWIGGVVLVLYIALEIGRSLLFQDVIHTGFTATAITFTFVASALIARVFGLRGRILNVLKEEGVL